MDDYNAMRRALGLAVKGWGRVSPNPLVGAVLVRHGTVVGEGYHAEFGGPHAEVRALESCQDPTGATCFVNLEPCSHEGKTPPCADALIKAGIRRVVYAIPDPHESAKKGAARLTEAGVRVESGACWAEAAALNAAFLHNQLYPKKPFVALKLATSLDGFLADRSGVSKWVSDQPARDYVHWLRAGFDAVAVGRRTAVADDPQLTVRGMVAPRVMPTRVVFSHSGQLDRGLRLVQSSGDVPTLLLVDREHHDRAARALQGTSVRLIAAADTHAALKALRERGIGSLLVEGGGDLANQLLAVGAVDRIYWIQAPILLRDGIPAFGIGKATPLDKAAKWAPTQRQALGLDTLLVVDRKLCLPES